MVVRWRGGEQPPPASVTLGSRPLVVIGCRPPIDERWSALCDVVVDDGNEVLDLVLANVTRCPEAAIGFALLLRGVHRRTLDEGLVAESATYSVLQSGSEFAAWRAGRPRRPDDQADHGPRVEVRRVDAAMRITLNRPGRLNALDRRMRDELVEALTVAAYDDLVTTIDLCGEGRAFCAGGDLDEFGSRPDPALAHLLRLRRSIPWLLTRLTGRTTAHLHGACAGSGIELAAFCGTVMAAADTQISLPELALGLVPGAGGTISIPRRIGRLHTAWLFYSGRAIDAATALTWGLVDGLEEPPTTMT